MTPKQLTEILKWAGSSSSELYFASGIASTEGVLILSRRTKGRALMHDLVQEEGARDLRSERYGKVVVSDDTVTFFPNKAFSSIGERYLAKLLKQTKIRQHNFQFDGRSGDGDE